MEKQLVDVTKAMLESAEPNIMLDEKYESFDDNSGNHSTAKNIKNVTRSKKPADKNQSAYKSNFENKKTHKFIGSDNVDIYIGKKDQHEKQSITEQRNKSYKKNNFNNCLIVTKDNKTIIDLTRKKEYTKNVKKDWCEVKKYDRIGDENANIYECPICFTESTQNVQLDCSHLICFKCISRIFHILKEKQCPMCKISFKVQVPAILTKPKCQICPFIGSSLFELQNHYKTHKKLLCIECTTNKAEFPSEYTLYTTENLGMHLKHGLNEENKNNFFGHIYCPFCYKYFYNADVCVKHCRKQHALCTICESMKKRHVYLNNMIDLKRHMLDLHFMCEFKGCEGVGYGHNAELVTHLLRTHKIGDGRVDLNPKKTSNVPVFCPYKAEEENKRRIKGETKGFISNATWEYENVDENNFSYKLDKNKDWTKREFVFQPKTAKEKSFEDKNEKLVMWNRKKQFDIENENCGVYLQNDDNTYCKNQSMNKDDILKLDNEYKKKLVENKKATFQKYKNDTQSDTIKKYEKITAVNYNGEIKQDNIGMPCYLKRDIIKKEKELNDTIKASLISLYPQYWEEIHKIVFLFLNKQINVEAFFERCEFVLGDKENVKFMTYITRHLDSDSAKVVNEYNIGYKERVTFPPFEKSKKIVKKQPIEKKYSFKIIDLTKKDKK